MAIKDIYKFPPKSRVAFYNGRGRLLQSTTKRLYDLADNLMLWWKPNSRTIYMGIVVNDPKGKWTIWDEPALAHIENMVREDLEHDGYRVRITRLCIPDVMSCDEEFRWKLVIRG